MQSTKNCLQCGKTITKPRNESVKNWKDKHKFCSKSCSAKFRKPGLKTRFKPGQKALNPIKKGQHLSLETQFKKGNIPWHNGKKGLMPTPWNKGKRFEQVTGSKHHNWKGGISGLNKQIRGLPEMRMWIMDVFKRDKFTCQCGRKRGPGDRVVLEAHHIKKFSLILKEHGIKSVKDALNCSELWDRKNGQTLCRECHDKTK